MKVRVDIKRMAWPHQPMSRRERMALDQEIGRELTCLLQNSPPTTDDTRRRSAPSVARQIAAAIATQLPPQPATQRTGRQI